MAETIYYSLVAAAAFFVKYATGFGNTVIMATLFSFVLPNAFITPSELLLNLPANFWLVLENRGRIRPRKVLRILVFVVLGVLPGVLFLKFGNTALMKLLLGLLVAGMGLRTLLGRDAARGGRISPAMLLFCGFSLGAYGVGAVLAGYLGGKLGSQEEFRGTLCCVFLFENIFRTGVYLSAGLLTREVFRFDLLLLPSVLAGLLLGRLLLKRIRPAALKNGVQVLLVLSGLSLCVNNLLALLA